MSATTTTTSPQSDPEEATWEQALAHLARAQTKKASFRLGGKKGPVITFRIRQLSQEERDAAEEQGYQITKGRRPDIQIRSGDLKVALIRAGVVEGPKGWTGSERDIKLLPADIRDQLADDIDAYSTLDDETFHGVR